jgi:hypothetical protein
MGDAATRRTLNNNKTRDSTKTKRAGEKKKKNTTDKGTKDLNPKALITC